MKKIKNLETELINIFDRLDEPHISKTRAREQINRARSIMKKDPELRKKWEEGVKAYAKENNIPYLNYNPN
jgi:hypothetical protein